MIHYVGHDAKRVADYVLWLARNSGNPLTPMQLLKLVYLCHGWMLGLYSRPLIKEQVEAWTYGPVVPSLYHHFKSYGGGMISEMPSEAPRGLDPEEENVIRQVWDAYGRYTGLQLSSLTHVGGSPWDITRRSGRGRWISNDLIEQHYRQLAAA